MFPQPATFLGDESPATSVESVSASGDTGQGASAASPALCPLAPLGGEDLGCRTQPGAHPAPGGCGCHRGRRDGLGQHWIGGQRAPTGVKAAGSVSPNFPSAPPGSALSHRKPRPKRCLPSVSISSTQGGDAGMGQGMDSSPSMSPSRVFSCGDERV